MSRRSRVPPEWERVAMAWLRWNERPGSQDRAIRLEVELQPIADRMAMTPTELRQRITERVRAGAYIVDAIHDETGPHDAA